MVLNSRVKAPELGLASASPWSIGKYDSPDPNLLTQKLPGAADSAGLRTYIGAPAPELGFLFPLGPWCPLSSSSRWPDPSEEGATVWRVRRGPERDK